MEKINKETMSHEQWLSSRRKGIGGSDVGAICGLSKWRSAYQLYLSKLDLLPKEPLSEAAYFGIELEDFVAREFEKRTGKKVREEKIYFRSKENPFMIANLDRVVIGENTFLECKTTSSYNESEWEGDNIPSIYMLQIQHYMYVYECDYCYIACLIGGQKFVWKMVEKNNQLIKSIIELEKQFWYENVVAKVPPSIDGLDTTTKALLNLFPKAEKESKELTEKELLVLKKLEVKKAELKELDLEVTGLENTLKESLGNYEEGLIADYKITWKNTSTNRLDSTRFKAEDRETYDKYVKTTESRRFNIKKI